MNLHHASSKEQHTNFTSLLRHCRSAASSIIDVNTQSNCSSGSQVSSARICKSCAIGKASFQSMNNTLRSKNVSNVKPSQLSLTSNANQLKCKTFQTLELILIMHTQSAREMASNTSNSASKNSFNRTLPLARKKTRATKSKKNKNKKRKESSRMIMRSLIPLMMRICKAGLTRREASEAMMTIDKN